MRTRFETFETRCDKLGNLGRDATGCENWGKLGTHWDKFCAIVYASKTRREPEAMK